MAISEEMIDKKWAEWETIMEESRLLLEAANDLGSTIKVNDKFYSLSSEKIQLTISELNRAQELVKKLEFVDELNAGDIA
ncbi:hypothetical protein ASB83_15100 [Listeria monocytogenes]|nr:hypothetical protein [Listeria monocytogenes]